MSRRKKKLFVEANEEDNFFALSNKAMEWEENHIVNVALN